MADSYTEVTHQSWFSRLGNAFKGIVMGIVLVMVAFGLLFWNEGRAVKRTKALDEGQRLVKSVESNSINTALNGQLIHTSGLAKTDETLRDEVFGIPFQGIRLERLVEMYQWNEQSQSTQKDKLGGGTETVTTYQYQRIWSNRLIDSQNFKVPNGHENPQELPYDSQSFQAKDVRLGAFRLSEALINLVSNAEPFVFGDKFNVERFKAGKKQPLHATSTQIYLGNDPASPRIGDVRVAFEAVPNQEVSVVAMQDNGQLSNFYTSNGGDILLLDSGRMSAHAMFQSAHDENTFWTWLLRLGGLLLMWIALGLILKPFVVLADVVPLIGALVGAGVGFITFFVALGLSLTTIAMAWFAYRPVLSLTVLIPAVLIGIFLFRKTRNANTTPSTQPVTPPTPTG